MYYIFIYRQHNGNKYRAIQLSVPTAIAHFRVVHRDADDNLIDTRDYNIDLNSGKFSEIISASIYFILKLRPRGFLFKL